MTQNNETKSSLLLAKIVEKRIFIIRGQRVVLSNDLADLYQVQPKVLVQAVKRNLNRFPGDFMFKLNLEEAKLLLRSQFVTLEAHKHLKYAPYAFTEQGIAMLSGVRGYPRCWEDSRMSHVALS